MEPLDSQCTVVLWSHGHCRSGAVFGVDLARDPRLVTRFPNTEIDVLIVGAGPTGLVLALWLTRLGVGARVIDKALEPGTTSRAVAVQARTLEFYRQIGIAEEVESRGRKMTAANLWTAGRHAARVPFGDFGAGLSPYPYALIYPQDEHERLLLAHLAALNVRVDRGTELVSFEDTDRVLARLRRGNAEETCAARYIVGCDGSHSTVRESLRLGFPGGTYEHLFYVSDVDAAGPVMNGEIHVALDVADFLVVFPLQGERHARLIGTVRAENEQQLATLSWDDVSRQVMNWMRVDVRHVRWFSTYHVHHRVANHFRRGRAFIAGDAAHVHSPVGGQGMNTGIGDAVNLAWKLAAVLRGRANAAILDTYEPERIAFANRLVETTDRAFTGVTGRGALARWLRLDVAPRVLPTLFTIRAIRRLMFRTVSQTAVNYRRSALSAGAVGKVRGGDRLPWVESDNGDNFGPLTSLDWQVHVYGDARRELREMCDARELSLHVFPWGPGTGRTGLVRDAVYLVRPDGYVGLVDRDPRGGAVAAYLDAGGLKSLRSPARSSAPGESENRREEMTDTIKIATCLWFNKNAEEAANFYAATFPNSRVTAVRRSPSDYPDGKAGDVLTVEFTVLGQPFVGLNGGPAFTFDEAVSFQVFTDTQEETDRYWNAIVRGGGAENACGWCKDRFGLNWQIVPRALTDAMNDPDTAAAGRAMQAMMTMKKIDIARIEAARAGDVGAIHSAKMR